MLPKIPIIIRIFEHQSCFISICKLAFYSHKQGTVFSMIISGFGVRSLGFIVKRLWQPWRGGGRGRESEIPVIGKHGE